MALRGVGMEGMSRGTDRDREQEKMEEGGVGRGTPQLVNRKEEVEDMRTPSRLFCLGAPRTLPFYGSEHSQTLKTTHRVSPAQLVLDLKVEGLFH